MDNHYWKRFICENITSVGYPVNNGESHKW